MKVQGTANCAAARAFDPTAVSTHEFSLGRVEDNVFPPEKSICYHGDAALPCQISLPVFYGWLYWTILLIPMMVSCSFWINRASDLISMSFFFAKKWKWIPKISGTRISCKADFRYDAVRMDGFTVAVKTYESARIDGRSVSLNWVVWDSFFYFVSLIIGGLAHLHLSCLSGSRLYEKPEASHYFSLCITIIQMQQSSVGHFSLSQRFSFCPAESPETARLWGWLNICVNVFASTKQTSSHWESVSRISVAGPDRSLTARLIWSVLTKEPSCCDLGHQALCEGLPS